MKMKNYGRRNVKKHKDIKDSDKYTALDISLKFGRLDRIRIISLDPKDNLGRLGKVLITSLGLKAKARTNKYKKSRYYIVNIIMKDLSKIIREFDKLPYKSYERRRPKHDPTGSYFYLKIQLVKCMMRAYSLNSHIYPVIM